MNLRPSAAFLAGVCTVALLSGCADQAAGQKNLAAALEGLDGVVSVKYRLDDSIFTLPRHTMKMVLDPELTEADARRIAQVSCENDVEISILTVTTNVNTATAGTVLSSQGPSRGSSCIAESALVGFAGASAAMNELRPAFDGKFYVYLGEPGSEDVATAFQIETFSTDRAKLLDALRALHVHLAEVPLEYRGEWDENGNEYLPDHIFLTASLSAQADLARLTPIVERAQELGVGSIAIENDSISVELRPETPPNSEAVLTELANQAGVSLSIRPAP